MVEAMNVSAQRIVELLATCLEIELASITFEATRENTLGWDSVVHLSLLGLIEDDFPGTLDRCPKLAEAQSISEIVSICNAP